MIKLLALLLGTAAAIAATAALVTLAPAKVTDASAQAAPQQLTMQILTDDDRMLGPNLVVHPGRVELTIVNHARHAHLFSVPALGIEHVILPGSQAVPTRTTFSFNVPKGAFHWFCALPCVKSMSGTIFAAAHPPRMHGTLWASA